MITAPFIECLLYARSCTESFYTYYFCAALRQPHEVKSFLILILHMKKQV